MLMVWLSVILIPPVIATPFSALFVWKRSEESRSPAISSTHVMAAQSRLRAPYRNPATSEGAYDDITIVSNYASVLAATSAECE